MTALHDRAVLRWVAAILSDPGGLWDGGPSHARDMLREWQAQYAAYAAIEAEALRGAALREVSSVELQKLERLDAPPATDRFRFAGLAKWLDLGAGERVFAGTLTLRFDRFGRIAAWSQEVAPLANGRCRGQALQTSILAGLGLDSNQTLASGQD